MGRASTFNSSHLVKSFDRATWTRFPLPLVPNAYQFPSAALRKLGSGKLVFKPSVTPFARLGRMGEPSTVGSRAKVADAQVNGEEDEKSLIVGGYFEWGIERKKKNYRVSDVE